MKPQGGPRASVRVSLPRGLGIREAIGVSVAGMGPTLAMNLNPQEPLRHVGACIPLLFLISTVLVLMVAWCFARLSRRHPNAGSAFGFVSAVMGPCAGLLAGWALLGAYLCFGMVGISGFGLFRSDLAVKIHPLHHPSVTFFTLGGAVAVALLCVTSARRAANILMIVEGVAVAVMLLFAAFVIVRVFGGHGTLGVATISPLFLPAAGTSSSAIALALSFGFLSFAGFEEVATMAEEIRRPETAVPRVLLGTVIGGGIVYTLVTAAEVLGYGTDQPGMARFAASRSLLGDLGGIYGGPHCGELLDLLATFSALGCGLAGVMGASRVLFAIAREVAPSSRLARVPAGGSSPVSSSLCVIGIAVAGYAAMRFLFHAHGSNPFFWASMIAVLALLVAYFLVVVSAGISILKEETGVRRLLLAVPMIAAAAIGYTLLVNLYPVQPGAYGVIPWIVLGWCSLPLLLMMAGMHRR